ncbi:hypothetical protein C8R45DRAFT_840870, partial [Mycena sanguinolenta]
ELWEKLKSWIRITDEAEFWACWEEIKSLVSKGLAPASVIEYLQTYYLNQETLEMWSAVYRKDRTIFELCDTNMLVEAWHHVLKGFHMDGKRNRRVDQLIHTLINVALPNYIANHRAQQFGFHGPDLALQKRNSIHKQAKNITSEMIEEVEVGRVFTVKSQSTPGLHYTVDLRAYTCEPCPSFPAISFCKHICAVEDHFPDLVVPRSLPAASQPWDEIDGLQHTNQITEAVPSVPPTRMAVTEEDTHLLHIILNKLQFIQRSKVTLPGPLTSSLRVLDDALGDVTNRAEILPATINKVAPNQGTASETASVMGTQRKGAKKRRNVDPYGGGEASGKLAKPDARTGKKARISPEPSVTPGFDSESQLPDLDSSLPSTPAETISAQSATQPSAVPPIPAGASASPEMMLMEALTRYNTMFPPHLPQQTSYYRENTYLPTIRRSYYC